MSEKATADERIFRTAGGDLVAEAHPDAAFLVYGVGAEMTAEHVEAWAKARAKSADKSRKPAANK